MSPQKKIISTFIQNLLRICYNLNIKIIYFHPFWNCNFNTNDMKEIISSFKKGILKFNKYCNFNIDINFTISYKIEIKGIINIFTPNPIIFSLKYFEPIAKLLDISENNTDNGTLININKFYDSILIQFLL